MKKVDFVKIAKLVKCPECQKTDNHYYNYRAWVCCRCKTKFTFSAPDEIQRMIELFES